MVTINNIKGMIFDMDGVLWRGEQPFEGLSKLFDRLSGRGIRYAFATNNATSHPDKVRERLLALGIQSPPGSVITSSVALAALLSQKFPGGGPLYIIGEDGIIDILAAKGFYQSNVTPLAVIAGLDRAITYEKLATATLLIRSGIPFYGTNPDRTFPSPRGLTPGAGSILAAIQAATDVAPIIAGKPFPAMIAATLSFTCTAASETLVVGDRLDTDIQAGINAGCPTALVLTGVTTQKDLASSNTQPDIIAADVHSLIDQILA
ncbi:MAG: HAD-IIA family hydrolase [Anaerolineae bacterium]|nr:HAD-IIA family hydrolase [Anaerolineae bacterium]